MFKNSLQIGLVRSARLASRFGGKGTAIIMYHSVQDDPAVSFDQLGGIVHSTTVFRGQMEIIARHCHPATLDQIDTAPFWGPKRRGKLKTHVTLDRKESRAKRSATIA